MQVGIIYDPIYLKHETGEHVESPQRLLSIVDNLEHTQLMPLLTPVSPRPATVNELALVHQVQYINHIQAVAASGGGSLDYDTVMSPRSYEVALYAAGGAIRAVESVMEGKVESAFALVRPPGHHASPYRAMGFCIFNNIAVAAKYAMSQYALERLAIIDFDVHHGNGTQAVFYADPRVLYISTHQSPLYPGTGNFTEAGAGEAMETTINIPLPPGCGDAEYGLVFEQIISPAVRRFKPGLILVSAGYDCHWAERISMMQVSVSGFSRMVKIIRELAGEVCNNHLAIMLEGGYNLTALAASVKATFEVLLGRENIEDPLGLPPHGRQQPDIQSLVNQIRDLQALS